MAPQYLWSARPSIHLGEGSTAWDADEAPSHEQMRTQGGACGRYSDLGALAVEREQAHDLCPGLIALEGHVPGARASDLGGLGVEREHAGDQCPRLNLMLSWAGLG